jgi:uncharacterized Fe-S cluster protein YjdI
MNEERADSNDREYSNGEITVYWKPSKCIHATTCYRELIEVFNPRKRPWVNMAGASTDEIIRVVDLCPTEALTYKRLSEKPKEEATYIPQQQKEKNKEIPSAEIKIMKDGPLIVKGSFIIRDTNNNEMKHMKMASFCRCGHSEEMPFCDGSHRKIGFSSD